ncbi:hypothetical protein WJX73_009371 [Symbiochloris irregularis]|uniref:Uncharacterized protein n=1 Tax=Symbiochloris irregularis TaxID=706552 RepID=A0AAW1NWR9_9CHLO
MTTLLAPKDKPDKKKSLKKQWKEWAKGLNSPRKDGVEKSKFSNFFRSSSSGGSALSSPRGSATSTPGGGSSPHKDQIKAVSMLSRDTRPDSRAEQASAYPADALSTTTPSAATQYAHTTPKKLATAPELPMEQSPGSPRSYGSSGRAMGAAGYYISDHAKLKREEKKPEPKRFLWI